MFVLVYAALLLASHLSQSTPHFRSVDQASSDATGTLILFDPLAESAPALMNLVESGISQGRALRLPELAGLNHASATPHNFSSVMETIAETQRPEVVLANGQAGVVALLLAAKRPDQVCALVLIDAAGVEEFALLGERHLNKVLFWVGGVALGAADTLLPHFGLLSDLDLRRSQLKILRHSDRRALRTVMQSIQQPVLLIETNPQSLAHSRNREHQRLLPQSTLRQVSPQDLESAIQDLPYQLRSEASALRIEQAAAAFNPQDRPNFRGGLLILTLLIIALATLVTEDVTCVITGLMIANGNLTPAQGIAACLAGILFGDVLLYLAGRHWGRPALGKIPLRWMIHPAELRETEDWFSRHAEKAILISRFVPGTRLPAYVAAGILGVPPRVFLFWFVLGGVIWTPLLIGVTMLISEQALEWIDRYHHAAPGLLVFGILLYVGITHILLPSLNRRGRRKLIGKWRRLTRPEYWPAPLIYAPVIMQLLLRAFRKESRILDFTICNPCMPLSGLVEESKSELLDQVTERDAVAPYVLLRAEEPKQKKAEKIDTFLQAHPPAFPVVLKPDHGQRGQNVTIAHSRGELDQALAASRQDWLLQQYVPGEEFGAFVILPPEEEGFVFGINGKEFPVVTGDGTRSLEDLILADERAVCQAEMHLRRHADRLYDIPAAGERIALTELGNHCRGTAFTERSDLITPALTSALLRIAGSLPGFTFGRMDLRVPSAGDFQDGKNIRILEINGVTSEAANFYDRRYSYFQLVRILLKQWRWASSIGQTHRLRGLKPASWRELFATYDRYHKRKSGHPPESRFGLQD